MYQTLQAFLGGAYVNQFNRFGRQWKVYLQAEPEYRTSADKINNFYVRNSKGEMTPLASLVTIKRVSGPEYTNRFNLFRSIQINGSPAPGYSSGQAMAAMEQVAAKSCLQDSVTLGVTCRTKKRRPKAVKRWFSACLFCLCF